jgi:hypothetical protein
VFVGARDNSTDMYSCHYPRQFLGFTLFHCLIALILLYSGTTERDVVTVNYTMLHILVYLET